MTTLAIPPLAPPATTLRARPDARLHVDHGGGAQASCALWWRDTPAHQGRDVGLIGHYAANDAQAGAELLRAACVALCRQGCDLAVGPMDGSSWERYRLVTEAGDEPPFLLEPTNPADWPAHFAAGLTPFAHYSSRIADTLATDEPGLPALRPWPQGGEIGLRPVNLADPEGELRSIYQLALASFRDNLLYSELPWADFTALYRPPLPALRPELATIAERAGQPVGFIFGVPDLLQARRGMPVDTLILKTCGVLPELRGCGLGKLLIAHCRRQARLLGYQRVIYALMRDESISQAISLGTTRLLRRYTLFARELAP